MHILFQIINYYYFYFIFLLLLILRLLHSWGSFVGYSCIFVKPLWIEYDFLFEEFIILLEIKSLFKKDRGSSSFEWNKDDSLLNESWLWTNEFFFLSIIINKIINIFIICYLLFIIYYLLFIIYYLLFIIYYLLFIIYYLLFIIYYLL